MASDELAAKLKKRTDIIDIAEEGGELPPSALPSMRVFNPYTEFKEFSRKEIQQFQKMFNKWVGCLDLNSISYSITVYRVRLIYY